MKATKLDLAKLPQPASKADIIKFPDLEIGASLVRIGITRILPDRQFCEFTLISATGSKRVVFDLDERSPSKAAQSLRETGYILAQAGVPEDLRHIGTLKHLADIEHTFEVNVVEVDKGNGRTYRNLDY